MKTYTKYIQWAIIVVLAILLWFKGCEGDGKTAYIEVPAKHGKFDTIKEPVHIPYPYEVPVVKWRDREIQVENPVNDELMERYKQAKDSIERFKMFAEETGIREYNLPLEDSLLITNNYIKAQGKVLAFQQSYTIKPQKIAVKYPETAFRLLGGVEVGNTKELNDFSAKGSLMLQNRKGNIFSVGYDTEQRIWVGYGFSIFEIKR